MKHTITVLIVLLLSNIISAQDFQGVATYKSKRQMDIQLDSTQVDSDMQKRMMQMLKKRFERTYLLTFNKEESVFKEEEVLESPQPQGMVMVMVETGGSDILYKNTKEERYTNQNETFGKVFLIKDKLQKQDWTLGTETKNIGDYTCYKATTTRERPVRQEGFRTVDSDEGNKPATEPEMEEVTITAWYTPQIPVNNGPRSYNGLPGLILEVNDGSETIICSKIVINPKEKVVIAEPSTGKEVNQEKFDAIMEKKMREMNDRFEREDEDGDDIRIRVRG